MDFTVVQSGLGLRPVQFQTWDFLNDIKHVSMSYVITMYDMFMMPSTVVG